MNFANPESSPTQLRPQVPGVFTEPLQIQPRPTSQKSEERERTVDDLKAEIIRDLMREHEESINLPPKFEIIEPKKAASREFWIVKAHEDSLRVFDYDPGNILRPGFEVVRVREVRGDEWAKN